MGVGATLEPRFQASLSSLLCLPFELTMLHKSRIVGEKMEIPGLIHHVSRCEVDIGNWRMCNLLYQVSVTGEH